MAVLGRVLDVLIGPLIKGFVFRHGERVGI